MFTPCRIALAGGILLREIYTAYWNGIEAGETEVERRGLYYQINCCCRLPEGRIYRLYAGGTCLGVLVPEDGKFRLRTRRSVKELAGQIGDYQIRADGQENIADASFYQLLPGQPVECLQRLEEARFCIRDGIAGLVFKTEK